MLENIKVVELASVLAGPMVGTFFAELGAKVIKIENKKTNGDVTRQWRLPSESKENNVSAYYAAANFNKEVLFLDLKEKEAYQKVLDLIKEADIVIANFKYGAAEKLRLDFQTLKAIHPTLIYGEITGFGANEKRTAFDVVLQAESGFMSMNGEPNRPPVKMPVALIDLLAAHQLKQGLLLALLNRKNEAQRVSVSLYESALASLANQATNWLMAKHIAQPMGSEHPNIAPYGDLFSCQDKKWLVLAIGNNRQFQAFCKAIQQQKWAEKPAFIDNQSRVQNRQELKENIQSVLNQKSSSYWASLFEEQEIPFGIVKNMQEVFENPRAAKMIVKETIENTPTQRVKTLAFSIGLE